MWTTLLPAVLLTTGIGPAVGSGSALAREMGSGALTRFRAMPVGPHWVLVARILSDLSRVAAQLALLLAAGALFFGFTGRGGIEGAVAALAVAVLVVWALMWVFLALGAWLRSTELMQSIGFVVVFPLCSRPARSSPCTPCPGGSGWSPR